MYKPRRKRKNKFSGKNKFIIHPSTTEQMFMEDEWLDIVDEQQDLCEYESESNITPEYLDPKSGHMVEIDEGDKITLNPSYVVTEALGGDNIEEAAWDSVPRDLFECGPSSSTQEPCGAASTSNVGTTIQSAQFVDTIDTSMVAPEVKTLRQTLSKIAAYTEKGIAQELVEKGNAILMADGTSQGWIRTGKIITTPIKVGHRTRRLTVLSVSKETRDNLKKMPSCTG